MQRPKWMNEKIKNHEDELEGKEFGGSKSLVFRIYVVTGMNQQRFVFIRSYYLYWFEWAVAFGTAESEFS